MTEHSDIDANRGRDDGSDARAATATQTTELPELIRAKLRPPADAFRPGARASIAAAASRVGEVLTRVRGRLASGGRDGQDAGEPAARAEITAAGTQTRSSWALRLARPLPALVPDIAGRLFEHGRRAGLHLGAALDQVVQQDRRQAAEPAVPVDAGDQDGVKTVAIERAVRRPAIFGPGNIVIAVLAGGIIHIVTTLLFATVGTGGAYRQLHAALPANATIVLAPSAPGAQALPYLAADMLYAFCRFDLSAGPVAMSAELAGAGWSFALYTRAGDNFYAAPGLARRTVPISVLLVPATDRLVNVQPGVRRSGGAAEVTSPDTEGLMVVRAPLKGVAFEAETAATLKKAACAVEPR